MSRRPRLLVASAGLVLACVGSVVLAGGGASALPRDELVVAEGAVTTATYGPLGVNNPSSQEIDPNPSNCDDPSSFDPSSLDPTGIDPTAVTLPNAPVLTASCDVVPIRVVPPRIRDVDDFFLEVLVTWTPAEEIEDLQAVNDLDIYLYDDQQIAKRVNPSAAGYTQVGKSAGGLQPELIRIFRPELGDYNLVVNNFSGPNTEYTIQARLVIGIFESPFEALAPSFGGPSDDTSTPADESARPSAPFDYSADLGGGFSSSNPFVGSILPAPASPTIGEVAVLPDADFDDFGTGSGFEERLARPPVDATAAGAFRDLAPAEPVGAAVLLFWFLAVPLVLAGAGWFLVVRRRSGLDVG